MADTDDGDNQVQRRMKILAVDDEVLILMGMTALLEDMGHEVLEASSGTAAFDLAQRHDDLDLIITDQSMPGMTGIELAKRLSDIGATPPMILATGYGDELAASAQGMVMLAKPYDERALTAAVERALTN